MGEFTDSFEEGSKKLSEYDDRITKKNKHISDMKNKIIETLNVVVESINKDFYEKYCDHYEQTDNGIHFVIEHSDVNKIEITSNVFIESCKGKKHLVTIYSHVDYDTDELSFSFSGGPDCKDEKCLRRGFQEILKYPGTSKLIQDLQ